MPSPAPTLVFNVAGQVSHLASMQEPLRDLDLNVRSHLAFLETLRRVAPEAVGRADVDAPGLRQAAVPARRRGATRPRPSTSTASTSWRASSCTCCTARHYDLPVTVLRLTNVYGPRQHLEREGLGFLPVFVRRALLGEDIVLYGDGTQRRDCVYVDDVVDALLLSATTPDAAGEIFNLGHEDSLTLAEIAELTQRAAGDDGGVRRVPFPDELLRIDIGSFHGDFSKAKRILGWSPRVSFADGIEATIRHYRDRSWSPSST